MKNAMTELDLKKYGKIIKEWRLKQGYTIKNLAGFIDVSPRTVSSMEKGGNVNTKYYIESFKLMKKDN